MYPSPQFFKLAYVNTLHCIFNISHVFLLLHFMCKCMSTFVQSFQVPIYRSRVYEHVNFWVRACIILCNACTRLKYVCVLVYAHVYFCMYVCSYVIHICMYVYVSTMHIYTCPLVHLYMCVCVLKKCS